MRSFAAIPLAALVMLSQVSAHCFISTGLGVSGVGTRADVQRPSTAKPCGTASLAAIDTSAATAPQADGSYIITATNFNAGTDGSTALASALLDTTGTGTKFDKTQVVTIVKNGVKSPTTTGSTPITITLPAGTTCTGGSTGDRCLLSVVTDGGFGNCVVLSSAAGTGATTAATTGTNTTSTGTTTTSTGGNSTTTVTDPTTGNTTTTTTTTKGAGKHHGHHGAGNANTNGANAKVTGTAKTNVACNKAREETRDVFSFVDSIERKARVVRSIGSWIRGSHTRELRSLGSESTGDVLGSAKFGLAYN